MISRLLHTKISQRANPPPYLETLRNKLASLRRKLLGRIDRRFKSLDVGRDVLVEGMCAFALATSSSAKDVLRHYHHMRQEAMSGNMAESSSGHESMLLALRLYVNTLRDTQAVIPSQLAHAMDKLRSTSLFKSKDLYSLMELNLDVHERWIGDDIKTFTPYIRHDDLSKAESDRLLKQWAKTAFSHFLSGLQNKMHDVEDPLALMKLRRQILDLWLSNQHQLMGSNTAENLDGLREVFNLQATRMIHSRVSKLDHVSTLVSSMLHNWQPGISDLAPSLWDSSMTSMEISYGGQAFREILTARSLGKNEPLDRIFHEYMTFLSEIEAVEETIKMSREAKWVDDMDEVDDDDDLLDNKQVLLSEDDPRLLQEVLNRSLQEAFTKLQATLGKTQQELGEQDPSRGQKACLLIRTWREIRQHLPRDYQDHTLGLKSIPGLQHIIANEVVDFPRQRCSRRLQRLVNSTFLPSRPLWEGSPELPILPSPWTYRLLLDVMTSMTACGSDIWSPQATNTLKKELNLQIARALGDALSHEPTQVNGHAGGDSEGSQDPKPNAEPIPTEEVVEIEDVDLNAAQRENPADPTSNTPVNGVTSDSGTDSPRPTKESFKNIKIQIVFDTAYLINATSIKDPGAEDNALVSLKVELIGGLGLETKSVERMEKDAAEYWKRTSLLFGLLA